MQPEPKAGDKWIHAEGERVVVVELGEVHLGPDRWAESVSYRDGTGKLRTRSLDNFLARFRFAPIEVFGFPVVVKSGCSSCGYEPCMCDQP